MVTQCSIGSVSCVAQAGLEPILKWAGGKRAIAKEIIPELGYSVGRYFEPFVGGAAIFFRLQPKEAYLSDVNPELIECYEVIKHAPLLVAQRLRRMKNSAEEYYRIRDLAPRSDVGRAARFIYLTSLSFNGIYRQNLNGVFNVPYGWKAARRLPDAPSLAKVSQALGVARLRATDFEDATSSAGSGDTVYFDPPYTVAHNNNGFVKYNKSIFSWDDQRRLANHARVLAKRGCRVVVSNADHHSVRELYLGFKTRVITRNSVIAASASFRREITECLFVSTGCTS